MTQNSVISPSPQTSKWPEDLSFKAFKKSSLATEDWVYKTVYALRREQIQVQNERIALIKLKKILRATFKLTASLGFHSMSLRQLSKESGISMGGLYAYIGSKEELANLIEHVISTIIPELTERAVQETAGTKEQFLALLCCNIYISEQLHPWSYFVFMESKSLSKVQKEKAKQAELDFEQRCMRLIEQGIKEGVFQAVDVTLTASVIMALLQDWYVKSWKHRSRQVTPDQYARFIISLASKQLGFDGTEILQRLPSEDK